MQSPALTPPSSASTSIEVSAEISRTDGIRWTRVVGIGIAGLGLVSAGITGWLALDARSLDKQATEANRPASERDALTNRASSRRRFAVGVGVGGGVLLATGLVLTFWPTDHAPKRAAWNLGVTPNGVAVFGSY